MKNKGSLNLANRKYINHNGNIGMIIGCLSQEKSYQKDSKEISSNSSLISKIAPSTPKDIMYKSKDKSIDAEKGKARASLSYSSLRRKRPIKKDDVVIVNVRIAVKKKDAIAVKRNRLRRRIKEMLRLNMNNAILRIPLNTKNSSNSNNGKNVCDNKPYKEIGIIIIANKKSYNIPLDELKRFIGRIKRKTEEELSCN